MTPLPGKVRHIQSLEEALESKSRAGIVEDAGQLARAAQDLVAAREREGRSQARIVQLEHEMAASDRRAGMLEAELGVYIEKSARLSVRAGL